MSLKIKITLIVVAVFGLFAVIDLTVIKMTVLPAFKQIEEEYARRDLKRLGASFDNELKQLDTLCRNWAGLEETYRFVEGEEEAFPERHFTSHTFVENDLNLIFISDLAGRVLWGETHDLQSGKSLNLTEFPSTTLPKSHPFISYIKRPGEAGLAFKKGLMMTQKGPIMLASRPIAAHAPDRPPKGYMIMGRFITDELFRAMAQQNQIDIQWWSIDDETMAKHEARILNKLQSDDPYHVVENRLTSLSVYTTYSDIVGLPILLIRTDIPRRITPSGITGARLAGASVLLAGILSIGILFFILKRQIFRPLNHLIQEVGSVGQFGDFSRRIQATQNDEIGNLTRAFNIMVEELGEAHAKRLEQSYNSGISDVVSNILHSIRNGISPMPVGIDMADQELKQVSLDKMKLALTELEKGDNLPYEREKSLTEYVKLATQRMITSVESAREIIDKLKKNMSRVDAILNEQYKYKKESQTIESVRIDKVIDQAISLMPKELTEAVEISIDEHFSDLPPAQGERLQLVRVLANLLNNAAESILEAKRKYGQINIKGSVTGKNGNRVCHLEIEDNGLGIPDGELKTIFSKDVATKTVAGMKISLHWSANVVARMQGQLYASSNGSRKGATLHLELPVEK